MSPKSTPNFFRGIEDLYLYLEWPLPANFKKLDEGFLTLLPLRIAQRIKELGPESSLAKEFIPHADEISSDYLVLGSMDPIGDHKFNKAPQLIHRYSNRALFTPTSVCPIHCRYCFRRNELSPKEDFFKSSLEETKIYLMNHPEIEEIIFTGGDPLSLSNEKLEKYFDFFESIPHIKFIRLHTRYPVILPERIDENFLSLLKIKLNSFTNISLAIHSNHLEEFDPEVDNAITKLASTQVQLLSQTVLLKGVNDCEEKLLNLFQKFISLKIRPYYLHHPDQVRGGMHFYLPIQKGREIYGKLRVKLPGWAIPQYVLDIPGGDGKIPLFNPESYEFKGNLINKNGNVSEVSEPLIN